MSSKIGGVHIDLNRGMLRSTFHVHGGHPAGQPLATGGMLWDRVQRMAINGKEVPFTRSRGAVVLSTNICEGDLVSYWTRRRP